MRIHDRPFVGSEALAAGVVKKHELRSRFRAIFPDGYASVDVELTLRRRAVAGWLWSHREGVIAELTASGLHGAKWVDEHAPIELVWANARPPRGLRTHDARLRSDEFGMMAGLPMTTPERTAFDLGRRDKLGDAVARLDALGNATGLKVHDVLTIAAHHRGARGLRQLATALDLYDPGAASPMETWLRLLLIDEGFPRPQTQIPVLGPDGLPRYYLDMGWADLMVAVEYDGEHHRTDRPSYTNDIIRLEYINSVGWIVVRVVAGNRRPDIANRVRCARESRLQ